MTHKVARASVTIQKELGALISTRLGDPRIPSIVSITRVDLAPDLSTARIFISTPGDEAERAEAAEALQSASGRLGRDLQSKMRIRRTPRLIFMVDDQIAQGKEMSEMIDRVLAEDHKMRTRRNTE